ncbi:MAG: RNA polymerase sigma factor [Bacillota bacterium]
MQNNSIIDFTLTYNKFKEPLFNYVIKIVRSEMLAEDIVHNTFMKLYDNLNHIRNYERIEIWIFTTARNEAFSHFRKKINKYEQDIELIGEKASSENFYNELETKELIDIVEKELGRMDPSQSEAYYLKEYSDLSYKKIAEIMNITEDLVKSRIFKVRQKLRKALINLER